MLKPVQDFGRAVGAAWRWARGLSLAIVALFLVWAALRVHEVWRLCHAVHPLAGVAFLLAVALALAWLVGRPAWRFLRVPRVMRPPSLPEPSARTAFDLVRHLAYVERYVGALPRNPEWAGSPDEAHAAAAACRALRAEVERSGGDVAPLAARVAELEQRTVARLLAPLDRKAGEAIRGEALRVGIMTAVSPYGSLDAFLVLWRNVNLVSRVATIYYGRPGPRGTVRVVRDVALATVASAYLDDLSEVAADAVASFAGKAAGVLAGPLLEGSLNAVATLRIGYVAKARCRAFSGWTARTRASAAKEAFAEAARASRAVVSEVVRSVGGSLLALPARAVGRIMEKVAGLFRRPEAETGGEGTATA
jgi:putative membrane protein